MAYKQKGWSPYTKKDCNCWSGYERVPGTKPCAKGSCKKSSAMKAYDVRPGQDRVEAKNEALAARGGMGSVGARGKSGY